MKSGSRLLAIGLLWMSVLSAGVAQDTAPDPSKGFPDLPHRWFTHARGYEQAKELQKTTGADIFLYISHKSPPGAKGLCTWWENKGLKAGAVQRLLRHYIKVELQLPSDKDTRELVDRFKTWEGPSIYIMQPRDFSRSIFVFEKVRGEMTLKAPETLVELILEGSSPGYKDIKQ